MGNTIEDAVNSEIFDDFTKAFEYDSSSNLIYAGRAPIGSSKASAVWQIKKMTYSGTDVTDVQWATMGSMDNIWNNRASLSYS